MAQRYDYESDVAVTGSIATSFVCSGDKSAALNYIL